MTEIIENQPVNKSSGEVDTHEFLTQSHMGI